MADINVRGYVNKFAVKEGKNGKFRTFTLSEGVKNKETGKYDNFFYNVTDFTSAEEIENGSRVSITNGWLKLRYYTNQAGAKLVNMDINVTDKAKLEVDGPPSKSSSPDPEAKAPWEE